MRFFKSKKAQNTAEYAIMVAIIIGVFSAMQLYVRRGLQSRVKGGVDSIPGRILGANDTDLLGNLTQYEPYYTANGTSTMTTVSSEGTERATYVEIGGVRTLANATTSRTGNQLIIGAQNNQ